MLRRAGSEIGAVPGRAQDTGETSRRSDGERRKSDLRIGRDTLTRPPVADLALPWTFSPGEKGRPYPRAIAFNGSCRPANVSFSGSNSRPVPTPPVWRNRAQAGRLDLEWEDTRGTDPPSDPGESRRRTPTCKAVSVAVPDTGGLKAMLPGFAAISGYTRGISVSASASGSSPATRKSDICPFAGLNRGGQVRTRDSSVFDGHAFRAVDSKVGGKANSTWRLRLRRSIGRPRKPGPMHGPIPTSTFRSGARGGEVDKEGLKAGEPGSPSHGLRRTGGDSVYPPDHRTDPRDITSLASRLHRRSAPSSHGTRWNGPGGTPRQYIGAVKKTAAQAGGPDAGARSSSPSATKHPRLRVRGLRNARSTRR